MNNKAIRILIVGGQGTGKTTLALELARIMVNNAISVTIVDDGDVQPFRTKGDDSDEYLINTIAIYPTVRAAVHAMPVPSSMIIDLQEGSIRYGLDGLPDELRQPIMDAAADQIKWVNEKFPMRNGRVIFKEEAGEISEEAMKKVLDNAKIAGEEAQEAVGKAKPMTDEAVTKALKNLAQDLAKMAKRQQKRRQIYRYIRTGLILTSCLSVLAAILLVTRDGADFIRALLTAIVAGLLSNIFPND